MVTIYLRYRRELSGVRDGVLAALASGRRVVPLRTLVQTSDDVMGHIAHFALRGDVLDLCQELLEGIEPLGGEADVFLDLQECMGEIAEIALQRSVTDAVEGLLKFGHIVSVIVEN